MSKIPTVSMKDLKERMPYVRNLVQKHGFVVVTKHGKPVGILHKLSDKDLQLTEKARKRIGL